MKFNREQLEHLLADLNLYLPVDQAIGKVNAYSVGTFQIGEHSLINIKRVKSDYHVRLIVKI